MLSESEAATVHGVLSEGIPLNLNQSFMVCDIEGNANVRHIHIFPTHRFLYNKERCIGCGDPRCFRRHGPDFSTGQFFGRQLWISIAGGAVSQVLEKVAQRPKYSIEREQSSSLRAFIHLQAQADVHWKTDTSKRIGI